MRIENGAIYTDTEGRILIREVPQQLLPRRKLVQPAEAPYAPWINQEPEFWAANDNH
ncbi:MAG: hypothetical protein WC880_01550 [Candidatus Paceibacterota bacterium]